MSFTRITSSPAVGHDLPLEQCAEKRHSADHLSANTSEFLVNTFQEVTSIALKCSAPVFDLLAAILCLVFGSAFLGEFINQPSAFSATTSVSLLLLSIPFLARLLSGPRTAHIDLSCGDVLVMRGWPSHGVHSTFSLSDYRRLYIRATRPVGTYELAAIDRIGNEKVIARSLSRNEAERASSLIASRLGLANDGLLG